MTVLTQGAVFEAKQDTVFVSKSPNQATDLSQYATSLSTDSGVHYELASARAAVTYPQTLYVRATFGVGFRVALASVDNTNEDDLNYYILGTNTGLLAFVCDDWNTQHVYVGPAYSDTADMSVQWATRVNPDAAGASDALLSEVIIYNHSTDTWGDANTFTHAIPATRSYTLGVGGSFHYDEGQYAVATLNAARIDRRFHTTVEFGEDWAEQRDAPAPTVAPLAPRWPVLSTSSHAASSGAFAGQGQVGEAAAAGALARRRLLSPLWNHAFTNVPTWGAPGVGPAEQPPLVYDDPQYGAALAWVHWATVPRGVSAVRVRVHVHATVVAGDAVPLGIRLYSGAQHPGGPIVPAVGETFDAPAYVGAVLTADHGSGTGEWVDLGVLDLQSNSSANLMRFGTTCLVIATAIDPSGVSANPDDLLYKIRAINVWPVPMAGDSDD